MRRVPAAVSFSPPVLSVRLFSSLLLFSVSVSALIFSQHAVEREKSTKLKESSPHALSCPWNFVALEPHM